MWCCTTIRKQSKNQNIKRRGTQIFSYRVCGSDAQNVLPPLASSSLHSLKEYVMPRGTAGAKGFSLCILNSQRYWARGVWGWLRRGSLANSEMVVGPGGKINRFLSE